MAKISAVKLTVFLLVSLLLPASLRCEEPARHDYILAVARLYSPKYVTSPSEESGGPYEGEIYLGGVYSIRVKFIRVVSGSFDVTPKRMRLIANGAHYFAWSSPKLLLIKKSDRFGYRIVNWAKISPKDSRNVCLPEDDVKSLMSDAMFTASDGHGMRCEHRPDARPR
ncbi:hypothetical protein ABC974_18120 [Sphingomonas oligophenolica]|uniref:DUF3108 domain-containing protein n=1 Tax=Sphingomonas oligophenolica TaxID=301154 RepID=A0ABU9Y6Y6_9SPHN